jgi:hypothetical protein
VRSTEYDLIHDLVINDPESVWDRLRAFLCSYRPESNAEAVDLIEDLMFWHPDDFIGRLQSLTQDCASVRSFVAEAHVGGPAITPGLERFYELQEACQRA